MTVRCVLRDFGNVIAFSVHRKACRQLAELSSGALDTAGRGVRLVLASNTNALHHDWFARQFADTLGALDAHVLSYRVGARKPEHAVFAACLAEAQCTAAECLYVDDRRDFVAVGCELGMTGVVYTPAVDVLAVACY